MPLVQHAHEKTGLALTADLADIINGTLQYGGNLTVTATGDALASGDRFNLFDAPAFSGTFGCFTLPPLANPLSWDTSQLPVDGTLIVIPEPGAAGLLAAGLACAAAGETIAPQAGNRGHTPGSRGCSRAIGPKQMRRRFPQARSLPAPMTLEKGLGSTNHTNDTNGE